jgi:hypothetical protein
MSSCNINFVLCGMIQTFQRVFNAWGYLDYYFLRKKEREREREIIWWFKVPDETGKID